MGLNNPVPRDLGSEARKAAKILTSFVKPNQIVNYEEVIPPHVLRNAKGLAIITVIKAGFLFSGRAGSGVIVARLSDGTWSPPSAIMTAGAGAGGMIGAEITDFIFVLNNKDAVKAFSKFGSITLGGNIAVAAGPLGRSGEAAGAASTGGIAAIFSYAKTKGLYAGVSLEGSVLVERKDANAKFYGGSPSAEDILSGRIRAPRSVEPLFRILDSRAFRSDLVDDDDFNSSIYDDMPSVDDYGSTRGSTRRSGRYRDDEYYSDDEDDYAPSRRGGGGGGAKPSRRSGRYAEDDYDDDYSDDEDYGYSSRSRRDRDRDTYRSRDRYDRSARSRRDYDDEDDDLSGRMGRTHISERSPPKPKPRAPRGAMQAIALYTFSGEESGDLSFRKGDVIHVTAKSDSQDDWWTGELDGRTGIFPANYVELS